MEKEKFAILEREGEYFYVQIYSELSFIYAYILYNFSGNETLVVDTFPKDSLVVRVGKLSIKEIREMFPELIF